MATHASPTTTQEEDDLPVPDVAEMNVHSMKGWKFFTGFLFWNVVACAGGLIFVALLTVWS